MPGKRVTKTKLFNKRPEFFEQVGVYYRVSTGNQEQLRSLTDQISRFARLCRRKKNWLIYDFYIDFANGPKTEERKEFTRMINDCHKHRVRTILTKNLGQFGNNKEDNMQMLGSLAGAGVDFIFEAEGRITSTICIEHLISMMGGFAREEVENCNEPIPKQSKSAVNDYQTPPLCLLTELPQDSHIDTRAEDLLKGEKLIETLKSFSIPAQIQEITHGPAVTRFTLRLMEGINVRRFRMLMNILTIELKAKGNICAVLPIPGTSFVGVEVPNEIVTLVSLRDVLSSPEMKNTVSPTAFVLGKDVTGKIIICELMDLPHLLIAGEVGSGKSVCLNNIICSLLYRAAPRHVRMLIMDPTYLELQCYNDLPHLIMPVITDPKKATTALDWVCREMDKRNQILLDAGVRNLDEYNAKIGPDETPLPHIIIIVNEMADLMITEGRLIEDNIKRITAKAHVSGVCLILATQRPSVDVITGVIKAHIPSRIAFRVNSSDHSKTILDCQGAEKLLGYGDMLYRFIHNEPVRIQGSYMLDNDVERTIEYIRNRNKTNYNQDLIEHVEQSDQVVNGNGFAESRDSEDK
jgi:DNA segregation ATPase FtsK/SpoIIIE, S-DNA-T family